MGNGNCEVDILPALKDGLLTPHGEREPGAPSAACASRLIS